jgi:hypothetical protein
MTLYIAPIVEGQTEQGCVEPLLHRIWVELLHQPERLQVVEPFRSQRDTLVHANGQVLTDGIQKAFLKLQQKKRKDAEAQLLLLILLDAEGDCPATLGPRLLQTARLARSDADIACVLAKRELENWFKAAAASLAGMCGLPNDLSVPANPEEGSGDAWLTRQIQRQDRRRKYTKPADAVELARRMDLQLCRDHSPSFDKLCRELEGRATVPKSGEAGA